MPQPPRRAAHQRPRFGCVGAMLALVLACAGARPAVAEGDASARLIDLVYDYRAESGLAMIPLSRSMTLVAAAHARDLERHPPQGRCTNHSWSANGPWSECCYTRDHRESRCMWNKPAELTGGAYRGYGFEIVCSNEDGMTPELAMACWRDSVRHHDVLLNRGPWRDTVWRAFGVHISERHAVLWLGRTVDRTTDLTRVVVEARLSGPL